MSEGSIIRSERGLFRNPRRRQQGGVVGCGEQRNRCVADGRGVRDGGRADGDIRRGRHCRRGDVNTRRTDGAVGRTAQHRPGDGGIGGIADFGGELFGAADLHGSRRGRNRHQHRRRYQGDRGRGGNQGVGLGRCEEGDRGRIRQDSGRGIEARRGDRAVGHAAHHRPGNRGVGISRHRGDESLGCAQRDRGGKRAEDEGDDGRLREGDRGVGKERGVGDGGGAYLHGGRGWHHGGRCIGPAGRNQTVSGPAHDRPGHRRNRGAGDGGGESLGAAEGHGRGAGGDGDGDGWDRDAGRYHVAGGGARPGHAHIKLNGAGDRRRTRGFE